MRINFSTLFNLRGKIKKLLEPISNSKVNLSSLRLLFYNMGILVRLKSNMKI